MKNASKSTRKGSARITTPVSEAESDRRLRPVLDALYLRNTKQALKLVQQALQKRPGWPAARALRACVFLQTERWNDAEQDILDLRADLDAGRVPIDEDAARKINIYYQELRQENIAAEVYEQAWRAEYANLRLAETAFCLYIRGSAFAEAQKLATKLHRYASSKTQKYALWATAALYLSIVSKTRMMKEAESPDRRILKLLCAMISKALAATTTPSAETVRFATRVYKEAGEFDAAAKLISNPRLVMDAAEVLQLKSELQSGEVDVEDSIKYLLNHDPDDWQHWLRYIDYIEKNGQGKEDAYSLIEKVQLANDKQKVQKRGPLLAKLEVLYRFENYEDLADSAVEYFSIFGTKSICAHDLRPYLCFKSESDELDVIFARCSDIAKEKGQGFHLTLSWLRLWFNRLHDTPEDLYRCFTSQLSDQLEATDRQSGDEYLLLAALKLLPTSADSQATRYGDSRMVLRSIAILESGLCYSPCNFHFKLLLMHLYIEAGAIERVEKLWESLEVKHVQISTLTHLVLRPFFETGHHFPLHTLLDNIASLWNECDKEIPECISKAFQEGSLNAAVEFVLFRIRLERSAILAEAAAIEAQFHLASVGGDTIGVGRALNYLTRSPRFPLKDLSSMQLINNDDDKCLRFWLEEAYNPDIRLTGISEENEEGRACSYLRKAMIGTDLQSLQMMLRLSSPKVVGSGENIAKDCIAAHTNGSSDRDETEQYSLLGLRLDIANNLQDLQEIIEESGTAQGQRDESMGSTDTAEILTRSKQLSQRIIDKVDDAVGGSSDSNAEPRIMTPQALRCCGRVCFDTLLITSVAVASFGVGLARYRRRLKKLNAKAGDQASSRNMGDFDNVRQAVLSYRDGILLCCTRIQEWVTACLESGVDWPSSIFSADEDSFAKTMSFLSANLPRRNLSDASKKQEEAVSREDLCGEIIENIISSHSLTCSIMLETLGSITSKMKLADL